MRLWFYSSICVWDREKMPVSVAARSKEIFPPDKAARREFDHSH